MAFSNMVQLIRRFMIVAVILILVGLAFLIYGAIRYESRENVRIPENEKYGIAIDAGGSGTRVYVYELGKHGKFRILAKVKCQDKGVANYNPDELNELEDKMVNCINQAKRSIPSSDVPVYFGATAGMRLLKLRDQKLYDQRTTFVDKVLNRTNLKIGFSKTISGRYEALYAWTAANILRNDKEAEDTLGIVELGSTSLQVAFETSDKTENEDISEIAVQGKKVNLYSHSYMCLGRDELEKRYFATLIEEALSKNSAINGSLTLDNPCDFKNDTKLRTTKFLNKSPCVQGEYAKNTLGKEIKLPDNLNVTFNGTGNSETCRKLLSKVSKTEQGKFGINKVYQPPVEGQFMGLSVFAYVLQDLQVKPDVNKDDYLVATNSMCSKTWSEMLKQNIDIGTPLKNLHHRCFDASYSYLLLTEGFKFNDDTWKINFKGKVNGKSVSWTLGMIEQEKDNLFVFGRYSDTLVITKRTTMLILIAIGVILLLIGLILLIILCYLQRRYEKKEEETLQLHMAS